MLKQLYISTTLLLLAVGAFAQSHRFADSTAQWNVLTHASVPHSYGGDINGNWFNTDKYEVLGDTFIGTKQYQKISHNILLRRDSTHAIYRWDGNEDVIFYHFGKQPGDTIEYPFLAYPNANFRYVITSVDSVFIGRWRKIINATLIGDISFNADPPYSPHHQEDTWIDGIGMFDRHPLAPGLDMVYISGAQKSMLCYSEHGNMLYQKNGFDVCDTATITDITKISNPISLQLYPNPANNTITLQSENPFLPQTNFQLFDITGKMILQKLLTGQIQQINVDYISKGLYLYTINTTNEKTVTGKLVVE